MQRGALGIARSYVDRASVTLPRHSAIAPVREALEKRARATAARPPLARETSEDKRVKRFIELAIRSMDGADFDLAQHYVDQAARIRPIRNGQKLGEEGVVGGMFQAGQNFAANRLTLPRRIMPGEYVVEHRVRSERATTRPDPIFPSSAIEISVR